MLSNGSIKCREKLERIEVNQSDSKRSERSLEKTVSVFIIPYITFLYFMLSEILSSLINRNIYNGICFLLFNFLLSSLTDCNKKITLKFNTTTRELMKAVSTLFSYCCLLIFTIQFKGCSTNKLRNNLPLMAYRINAALSRLRKLIFSPKKKQFPSVTSNQLHADKEFLLSVAR